MIISTKKGTPKEELEKNLGTIAKSGSEQFLREREAERADGEDARDNTAEAAERAQKRKKEREARQQKFEATLQERVEAQKRYEESQKNKDSGLSKLYR